MKRAIFILVSIAILLLVVYLSLRNKSLFLGDSQCPGIMVKGINYSVDGSFKDIFFCVDENTIDKNAGYALVPSQEDPSVNAVLYYNNHERLLGSPLNPFSDKMYHFPIYGPLIYFSCKNQVCHQILTIIKKGIAKHQIP